MVLQDAEAEGSIPIYYKKLLFYKCRSRVSSIRRRLTSRNSSSQQKLLFSN